MSYAQLTKQERYQIYKLMKANHSHAKISRILHNVRYFSHI